MKKINIILSWITVVTFLILIIVALLPLISHSLVYTFDYLRLIIIEIATGFIFMTSFIGMLYTFDYSKLTKNKN